MNMDVEISRCQQVRGTKAQSRPQGAFVAASCKKAPHHPSLGMWGMMHVSECAVLVPKRLTRAKEITVEKGRR